MPSSAEPMTVEGCLACDLTGGRASLPGGRIYEVERWVVEHCIGPFGLGALIAKPFRHFLDISEMTDDESAGLGPLLQRVARTITTLVQPDQVYVCLCSHAGWEPGHIHCVLQPSWNNLAAKHERPGPFLQVDMLQAGDMPSTSDVEAFAARARELMATTPPAG